MSAARGDAELASVMRKPLTASEDDVYTSLEFRVLRFYVDGDVEITEEEQQAIEEVWGS